MRLSVNADVDSGAAGFEAMKAYENHCEQNGKPENVRLPPSLLGMD
jgi:hypothetical protein